MKRSLLIVCALSMMSVAAMAQKGSFYLGGNVGYHSSTTKPNGGVNAVSTTWSFAPEAGTFLKDDIQLGFALGLSGDSYKVANNKQSSSTTLSPTVYVRKFFKVTDNFSVFAGAYLSYISGTSKDYTVTPTDKTTKTGVGMKLGAGVAYALSPRFTAVGQYGILGFESVTNKFNGTTTSTVSSFDFGVNTLGTGSVFNVGLYYTLKKAD